MAHPLLILPFHAACLAINAHHWMHVAPIPGTKDTYWSYAQFLTMWGLGAHTIYFFLSTLDDLVLAYQKLARPSPKEVRRQNRFLHTFFRAFSFPLATIVAILFWGVYAIDREMIYPKAFEVHVPPYMNHIQHTVPLLSVLIDMFLIDHYTHPPKSLRLDLLMVGGVTVAYMCMLLWVFMTEGHWVYPFIELLPDWAKVLFFLFGMGLAWVFYFGGVYASSRLWQKTRKQSK
eukprot:Phypoly_transcript_17569.p1 GENE.Phypoly_transcript_17569~~Phypoly_transcript_17569.p1  ORF type:complete len:251 (+),score=45.46 Phypoly_transcript_17569:59-754(+)